MKTILNKQTAFVLILSIIVTISNAQNTENNTLITPDTVNTEAQKSINKPNNELNELEIELDNIENDKKLNDTTKIRIGKKNITIIDDGESVIIDKDTKSEKFEYDKDWSWDNDDDFNFKDKNKKKRNKFEPHWAGIHLGFNNYLTPNFSTMLNDEDKLLALNTNKSMEFAINLGEVGINLFKNRVGLVTGLGFKWNNYKFRNTNTVLVSDSTPLYFFDDVTKNNKLSKLTTCYLIVPVMLELQFPVNNEEIYLTAGVEGGLKLNSWTKIVSNSKAKTKDNSDFHVNTWDCRAAVKLGYGDFGVYGSYSLMPLFEKNKGPELYPITVGVSLNF